MIVLGFDPSKNTGWCAYDTKRDFSAIRCGVLEMPQGADHYYTSDQIVLKDKNPTNAQMDAGTAVGL